MKNIAIRSMMLAAVAAVIGVGTASAQDLKAKIPFKFEANTVSMPAGDYTITSIGANSGSVYLVRNDDSRKAVMVAVRNPVASKAGDPRLEFRCSGGDCALSQLWTSGSAGYQLVIPHHKAESDRIASVRTVSLKAD